MVRFQKDVILTFIINTLAIFIVGIACVKIFNEKNVVLLQDAMIWSILAGLAYRMKVDIKDMNFVVGTLFCTASVFVFRWEYVVIIYAMCHMIYEISCILTTSQSMTSNMVLSRKLFIISTTILSGFIGSISVSYFGVLNTIDFRSNLAILIFVCILESLTGIIIIYADLKFRDNISSIINAIKKHLVDNYGLYISYFCIVLTLVVMFSEQGYLGLLISSSYIISLQLAFNKQEKVVQMEEESCIDTLTGVKNKKFFLERIPETIDKDCSLFFIDFNGFKGINDTYGHDVGDEVIKHGAAILSKIVRERDSIIRFGGDEFMLIIDNCDYAASVDIIDRISTLCKEMHYLSGELDIQLSMAIGVSICPEESREKEILVTIADEKMYKAKKNKNGLDVVYSI